jgi:hypothetical protein
VQVFIQINLQCRNWVSCEIIKYPARPYWNITKLNKGYYGEIKRLHLQIMISNLTTYINTSNNNNNKDSNRWEQVWNTVSFLGRHFMVETQIPSISKFSTSYVHLLRWYRRRIERIMFWITLWGILFHSSNNAWRKVAPVVGLTGRLSTRLPNTS